MSQLIHLIYNSVAREPDQPGLVRDILHVSRSYNAAAGITGMLLYMDGTFFQVLEGEEAAVDALAARIVADPRHERMTTIIREPIARRAFGEWTMGFAQISADDLEALDGANDFFGRGRVLEAVDAGRARKLLEAFKQGRWRVRLSRPAGRATTPAVSSAPDIASRTSPAHAAATATRPAFSFAFQPIVDVALRKSIGYEALIRGPEGEPAAAVLQAVPLEDISDFDDDARRVAIAQAMRLGLRARLHLNVTPMARMSEARSLDGTLDTAQRCGLPLDRVVLEIKHEATMSDPLAIADWLKPYRSRGVKVSIDDFGSGHAGLALLDHYQPEIISLSMWLVRGIEGHGPRQAILRGLAQTCGDLGIDLVAKGVETEAEYNWLRAEGVTLFQGHLMARPALGALPRPMLPAEDD